jgi:hypothetical protein
MTLLEQEMITSFGEFWTCKSNISAYPTMVYNKRNVYDMSYYKYIKLVIAVYIGNFIMSMVL